MCQDAILRGAIPLEQRLLGAVELALRCTRANGSRARELRFFKTKGFCKKKSLKIAYKRAFCIKKFQACKSG